MNLPFSSSNTQAALRSSPSGAPPSAAERVRQGLARGLRQPCAASHRARLGRLDPRHVGLRDRRGRLRLRSRRRNGGRRRRARPLAGGGSCVAVCRPASGPVRPPVGDGSPRPFPCPAGRPSNRCRLLAGFRTIARERRLRLLVGLFSAQTFVDGMLNVLIVVIALKLLDTGRAGVGFLNSAVGIGGLLGALAAAALVGRRRLAADFGLGIFIWGVPIALVAVWPNQVFALVLLGIVGIGNTLVDVSGMTLLQRAAPDEVLARVFGVLESLLLLTVGLGALVAPLLLNWLGTRGALIVAGALLPAVVVPAWPRLNAIDRAARVPAERVELLRKSPIFAPLPEATLEQLADRLDEVRVVSGHEVVRQGEAGDRFYLVGTGTLDVAVDGRPVQHLGPGESFGEIALLRDVPRTATVTARSDAVLYTLDRGPFISAVTGFASSLSAAEAVIGMRLGPARGGIVRA